MSLDVYGLMPAEVLGAKHTIYIKTLIDIGFDFGLKDYPIFDTKYRKGLNTKLLGHYLFNEICCETPALFRHYLNQTMLEIMPYYNQLYVSQLIEISPFLDFSHTEKSERKISGDTTSKTIASNKAKIKGTSTTDGENLNVNSDTPQNFLSDTNNPKYATKADKSNNKVSGNNSSDSEISVDNNNTGTLNNVDDYFKTFSGYNQSQSDMLIKYRQTFLNIDMEIITNPEIRACFYGGY